MWSAARYGVDFESDDRLDRRGAVDREQQRPLHARTVQLDQPGESTPTSSGTWASWRTCVQSHAK